MASNVFKIRNQFFLYVLSFRFMYVIWRFLWLRWFLYILDCSYGDWSSPSFDKYVKIISIRMESQTDHIGVYPLSFESRRSAWSMIVCWQQLADARACQEGRRAVLCWCGGWRLGIVAQSCPLLMHDNETRLLPLVKATALIDFPVVIDRIYFRTVSF